MTIRDPSLHRLGTSTTFQFSTGYEPRFLQRKCNVSPRTGWLILPVEGFFKTRDYADSKCMMVTIMVDSINITTFVWGISKYMLVRLESFYDTTATL